jgi:hypothetical protein
MPFEFTKLGFDRSKESAQRTRSARRGRSVGRGPAHSVFVEEFGPETWTYQGGPGGEACAIAGLQSCLWNTLNQNFFASLLPFLSSQGVNDASLYGTEILGPMSRIRASASRTLYN